MRVLPALLLTVLLWPAARAQTPGDCATGRAQADLDVSDVRATLFNTGSLFFGNGSEAAYIVPQGSGASAAYAANVWVGGTVGGEIRTAAATFGNFEFWPGPLDDGATLPNPDDCSAYDRIYSVTPFDVRQYQDTGTAPRDLDDWPVGLGALTVDASGAPVVPTSRDQTIDLAGGERPVIYGSQTAFWVMNDVGGEHRDDNPTPLGVEVAVTAFAVISDETAIDQATIYRYAVTNRNTLPIEDAYVSLWVDTDIGDAGDEYQGVDLERAMAFTYNANPTDNRYGVPPAVGYDFLSTELGAHRHGYNSSGQPPQGDQATTQDFYNTQQGLWNDGTPMTAFGRGYQEGGEVTRFAFPADPVTGAFWSELNADGQGTPALAANKRTTVSTPVLSLAPGETYTLDFAIVFAQGTDNVDSITQLRAASDVVQAAYDDGSLFETGPTFTLLPSPTLVSPEDGASFVDEPILLEWTPVPGATYYVGGGLVTSETQGLYRPRVFDETTEVSWSITAFGPRARSYPSERRAFSYVASATEADFRGEGRGIVEVARPAGSGAVCPVQSANDWGCTRGLGNTVFNNPDGSGDYAVGADRDDFYGPVTRIRRYVASLAPATAEMRFTDAGGYGLDLSTEPGGGEARVWSVPFELWNLGEDADDAGDDVRMIPSIVAEEDESTYVWADAFPRVDELSGAPATARVYGMMPDRRDGYTRFEAAAIASGVGQIYADTDVTDTPIDAGALLVGDVNPSTGEVCANTGGYVSFCYRNDQTSSVIGANPPGSTFVYPIGRVTLLDLAGDGTTPPAGTVIRFLTTAVGDFAVSDEGGPAVSTAARLLPVRPNPSRGAAVVPFELQRAGAARLTVLDALGRTVAVLVDGDLSSGAHEAAFDGARLASGVYVVVLEAGGERLTRTLSVTR